MNDRLYRILISLCVCAAAFPFAANGIIINDAVGRNFADRIGLVEKMYPGAGAIVEKLPGEESSALKWLYAYMPTPDITAYSPDFFLSNVRASLLARKEMPWGHIVPEREFRHFVLPVRVNNENLDNSREVFYGELRDRVKGLSMRDAILEVNHWCHEKVAYQPSDGRTSSPLSSVSQAIGRCGEESTFTVAALRSVGIPARQVYTPRWAHTDDNHAWVEAWADGKWYFLGACEPEPELNIAWFNAPASRGMMMTTNVFGQYDGDEEILVRQPLLTTINVTSNYAPVGELLVRVIYPDGTPAEGARVNFCVYNYADLYPMAVRVADSDGEASLTSGLGDILVWATDGSSFGFAKGNPKEEGVLELTLDKNNDFSGAFEVDLVPPRQSGSLPVPSKEAAALNVRRLAQEDSIRNAYMSTFIDEKMARDVASGIGTDADKTVYILTHARGNGERLVSFLRDCPVENREKAVSLLCAVSEKDLRDIPMEVLRDNLENTPVTDSPLYVDYVLNPRVENEWLVPYKSFFRKEISPEKASVYRKKPMELAKWVMSNIELDTVGNPSFLRMDPRAVFRTGIADNRSRNILFVSMARSMGIPARIDPVTAKTQYASSSGEWIDVSPVTTQDEGLAAPRGVVCIDYSKEGRLENPKYYSQFAISRMEHGVPVQLEYGEGDGLSEIGGDSLLLDEGRYMLLSGRRMADGSVLARGEIFGVSRNSETRVPLKIRKDENALSVIGSLNAENMYTDALSGEEKSIISTTGRGYYVLALVRPNNEPTSHILNDISAVKEEFEKRDNKLMLLFGDEDELKRFNSSAFPNLPSTAVIGVDFGGVSLAELKSSLNLESDERPLVVVADTFNRVVFATQGYSIGIGDRLADILDTLSK